jgi:hypothetical protein
MFSLVNVQGKLKVPVKAYRSHGNEFIIYKTSFGIEGWEDVFAQRICILNVKPHKHFKEELQELLIKNNYLNYKIVAVSL